MARATRASHGSSLSLPAILDNETSFGLLQPRAPCFCSQGVILVTRPPASSCTDQINRLCWAAAPEALPFCCPNAARVDRVILQLSCRPGTKKFGGGVSPCSTASAPSSCATIHASPHSTNRSRTSAAASRSRLRSAAVPPPPPHPAPPSHPPH